jgi:hypothetical protein
MRALSGKKAPERVSDPIIHHGDVRRMLLTSKVNMRFCMGGDGPGMAVDPASYLSTYFGLLSSPTPSASARPSPRGRAV